MALVAKDNLPGCKILIFTRSNYHWFRKNCLYFPCEIERLDFSRKREDLLSVAMKDGTINIISFGFEYKIGEYTVPKKNYIFKALASMTDHSSLLVSPFGNQICPPPTSLFKISAPGGG